MCHSPAFRPYTCVDVLGCELGGAYKNVVGLAVGMAVGLGFGDNTTASVITRGLAETAGSRPLGANPLTLMGLAGLGDLVATCSSPLSRNRTFGEKLGQGMTTDEIFASTRQVAEGAKSCSSLRALAERTGVDAPIAEYVDDVVAGRMTAAEMMDQLHLARHQGRDRLDEPLRPALVQRLPEVVPTGPRRPRCRPKPHQALGDGRGLGLPAAPPLERRLDAAQAGGVHPEAVVRQQVRGGRPWAARSRSSRRSRGSGPRSSSGWSASRRASSAAFAWARSMRRCRVRRPRSASQASNGPGVLRLDVAAPLEYGEDRRRG